MFSGRSPATKLAVAASTQYATNGKYVEVNSGRHPQIRVHPGMHALSPDEVDVYSSLVENCASARVTVMHNHCLTEQVCVCSENMCAKTQSQALGLTLTQTIFAGYD